MTPTTDDRLLAGTEFAAKSQLHPGTPVLTPASADASFRRYFRATWPGGETAILMDAPPDKEDVRPFIQIAGLMADAGLVAPQILAADAASGYLLLNDLGSTGYLKTLHAAEAKEADVLMRGYGEVDRAPDSIRVAERREVIGGRSRPRGVVDPGMAAT